MSPEKTRILLTGASGAIGSEVARQLVRNNNDYELVFFDLNKSSVRRRLSRYKRRAKIVYGDIRNRAELEQACHHIDIAIHLAAIIPIKAYTHPEETREVNIDGTQLLLECLEKNSPGCFLLYSSSISVYGDRLEDYWISVNDELKPSKGDNYGKSKIAAEKAIKESKLKWSIFRLTAIMGNHKPSGLMFFQPLSTKMEIATIEDTGRAFVNALECLEKLEQKVFNLGGGKDCRIQYDEFLERSFRQIGLGGANFPENAFAEQNFHCAYYKDSDVLNDILEFRRDDLEAYLKKERDKYSGFLKLIITMFRGLIKWLLLTQSEPYRAIKQGNQKAIEQFFKIEKHGQET